MAARRGASRPEGCARGGLPFVWAALLLAGCVTRVEGPVDESVPSIPLVSVVIPIPSQGDSPQQVRQFYDSLLGRLGDASRQGDLDLMRALLAGYRRSDAPEWVRQSLDSYEALAMGYAFDAHAAATSRLEAAGEASQHDEIGEAFTLELVLEPMPGEAVRVGGTRDADALGFHVVVAVLDEFVDGSSQRHEDSAVLRVPDTHELAQQALRLPLLVALDPSRAVRRRIDVRAELLPGFVRFGEVRAPVGRSRERGTPPVREPVVAVTTTLVQWPRGYQAVRAQPLATLRAAIQRGDAEHFPHVRLAAEFASDAERARVQELLIDQVRLGRPDQALVAMATLRATGAADIAIGDRERWLAWWQARR